MGKTQPKLRFPEFKSSWFEHKLSDFLTFKNGINASKESYGKGYKFINVLDIIQNDFITHEKIIGSVEIDEKEFRKNIVEYGDVLFQRSSETREEVGQANVYLDKDIPATFGGFVIRGKRKADYIPEYINALLKTSRSRKEITSKSGGSTRYNIGQETLSEVVIYTTEIPEQQKIATFLTSIDQRIQLLEKKKAKLEAYKKGVMQQIFSQEVRFKDENGKNYPDWEEKKLGDVLKLKNGYAFKSSSYNDNGDFKIITISNVQNGILDTKNCNKVNSVPSDIQKHQQLAIGDLLVSLTGNVGRIAQVNIENCLLNQRVGKLEVHNAERNFIFLVLRDTRFISKMISLAQGGAQPNLGKSDIELYQIKLPSVKEQQKIAKFLSSIDKNIAQITQQIEMSKSFKKGLLQKMFV